MNYPALSDEKFPPRRPEYPRGLKSYKRTFEWPRGRSADLPGQAVADHLKAVEISMWKANLVHYSMFIQ